MSASYKVSIMPAVEFQKWLLKLGEETVEPVVDKYLNERCAQTVQEMKDQLGNYQQSRGDFQAWPPLQPETIATKRTGDSPLYETGEMQAECQFFDMGPLKKLVGCTNHKAAWHEYGAPLANVPARPFVRPVVWLSVDDAKMGMRKALITALRQKVSML